MIHVSWAILAGSGRVDTTGVATEVIDNLEGDGDWLLVDGLLEFALIALSDVDGVADGQSEFGGVRLAGLVHSSVWIVSLSLNSASVVDVLEGVRWQSTIATVVIEVTSAVDKLLLSVGLQDTILDEVGALQASDG